MGKLPDWVPTVDEVTQEIYACDSCVRIAWTDARDAARAVLALLARKAGEAVRCDYGDKCPGHAPHDRPCGYDPRGYEPDGKPDPAPVASETLRDHVARHKRGDEGP